MNKEINNSSVFVAELSKYVQPTIEPKNSYSPWLLNGDEQSFFKYIRECYEGSVTNGAIINAYASYILGKGFVKNKYLTKTDARLITLDYKMFGGFAIQVIWNQTHTAPIKFRYLPIEQVGLKVNDQSRVIGYYYCFDWSQRTRYVPKEYAMYTGQYKGNDVEIMMVQRPSAKPFFANPDYIQGLQYAQLEMELANSSINHVLNGFQGGAIVNFNKTSIIDSDLRRSIKNDVIKKVTGTTSNNSVIVSFNEEEGEELVVTRTEVEKRNEQHVHFNETAELKLIVAHSAPPILFAGSKDGGGLGNNAEEIKEATKSLYRKHIFPMREIIEDGLNEILETIEDETFRFKFDDYESFDEDDKLENTQE